MFERLKESGGALLEPLLRAVIFLSIQRIARVALLWRIDLHLHKALSDNRRTQHDAHKLVNLRLDLRVETYELKVAAAVPALAHHAFRYAVQGREFHVVELLRLFLLEVAETLFEGGEFADEDVGLVHLVRNHHELLFCCEFEDAANSFGRQTGAGGVARVYDDDCTHICAFLLRLLVRGLDSGEVCAPGFALIEIVRHTAGV